VLFDTDGTLVDSAQVVESRMEIVGGAAQYISEDVLSFSHGRPTIATLQLFIPGQDQSEELDKLSRFDCPAHRQAFAFNVRQLGSRNFPGSQYRLRCCVNLFNSHAFADN
jgi:beta-phosphoglucomutase-like phosphatase (HAD superfamily)